jgi:hypothetical protein
MCAKQKAAPNTTPCPNCTEVHTTFIGVAPCLIHLCVSYLVNERESLTRAQGMALLGKVDETLFWSAMGAVLDQLEEGELSVDAYGGAH